MLITSPSTSTRLRLTALLVAACLMILALPAPGVAQNETRQNEQQATESAAQAPAEHPAEQPIAFQGKLYCSLKRTVAPRFLGVLQDLRVHTGQRVKSGDVLASYTLDPSELRNLRERLRSDHLAQRRLEIANLEAQLDATDARLHMEDLKLTIATLEQRRAEAQSLVTSNMASSNTLNQIDKELKAARTKLELLQARIPREQRQISDRIENIRQQIAREKQRLQVEADLIAEQLGLRESFPYDNDIPDTGHLRAPIDGVVVMLPDYVRPQAELASGETAFMVGVMDPMLVRAHVYETEARNIHVGQTATISPESLPGQSFEAQVHRLAWQPVDSGLTQPSYYAVELKAPNPDLAMKEGFKSVVVIKN